MLFACTFCEWEFGTNKGLKIYFSRGALKRTQVIENNITYNEYVMNENVYNGTQEEIDTILIM